jgi:hypothetical protein
MSDATTFSTGIAPSDTPYGGVATGSSAVGPVQPRERILQAYLYLEPEDIDAALAYAACRMEEREEPLVAT